MSGTLYLDQDTADQCIQFLRDGGKLDDIAGRLHLDTELLGRLLQLPTTTTVSTTPDDADYLWAVDRLDGVL